MVMLCILRVEKGLVCTPYGRVYFWKKHVRIKTAVYVGNEQFVYYVVL